MRLRSYPSGKTVDKQRRTHCNDEDDNDTDNKVFDHITSIDFFFVLVCDCNLDSYERSLYYIHVHLRHQQNVPSRFSFATHKSSSNTFLAILCFQAFSFPYEFFILFLRFATTIIVTTIPARITTAPTKIKAYPHIGI